jgi:large subunit ribosomal protein L15
VEEKLSLSTLKPAQKRRARKRVGRGLGSGNGRYSGRGIKGQKARAGSHRMRIGFEGGQMPLYMRLGKQRGSTSKDAMPIGPFRTATQAVNVGDIERVYRSGEAVTIETLLEKGLIKNTKVDVKILGDGELKKKLSFTAHRFSKGALAKIKAAGGSATALRAEEPPPAAKKKRRQPSQADEASEPNEGVEVIEAVEATETVDS